LGGYTTGGTQTARYTNDVTQTAVHNDPLPLNLLLFLRKL